MNNKDEKRIIIMENQIKTCAKCKHCDPVNDFCRNCGNYPDEYPDCRTWCNVFPID